MDKWRKQAALTEREAGLELTDFRAMFERGEIENGAFGHPSHLRVAWVYLHECGSIDEATDRMAATLRQFAASAGKADKYHQTLTVFWVQALALAGGTMDAATAAEVMRAHPWLLAQMRC